MRGRAIAFIADLQRTNRVLLEETLERLKEVQYGQIAEYAATPRVDATAVPGIALGEAGPQA